MPARRPSRRIPLGFRNAISFFVASPTRRDRLPHKNGIVLRLKLVAAATVALALAACDANSPPAVDPLPPATPAGAISGSVTIEGTAAAGVAATLSSGASATTGADGGFSFADVEAGTYTVTISGYPEDATFAQATQSATIATDGENVRLSFAGEYVRSSAVVGAVVAADATMSGGDGQPETLAGVTATLGGAHATGETARTGTDGGFAFAGLRAGTYTVEISGYPEDVSFETKLMEVEVEAGEVGNADFTGRYVRTSAVEVRVVVEGEEFEGATVALTGGPANENRTAATGAGGRHRFEGLRAGAYGVSVSGFDAQDHEFASTSRDVSVEMGETATVSFTGVLLRTSGISGRVSVEGMGLSEVEVTLSGADEERATTTDASGQYAFAGLETGDYAVSIGVEGEAYEFEATSVDVTLGEDESRIVNFEGEHARTASVSGTLFIDEAARNGAFDEGERALAQSGIPVALVGPEVNEQRVDTTDANGRFAFTGLRDGPHRLVVLLDMEIAATLAAMDLAYGGPAAGYDIDLGVGEAASRPIPFRITHTTIDFKVSLKIGGARGDALPGATVDLYANALGGTRIGGGETGDDGSVSIRVARTGATGNTVHAAVALDGYHVDPDAGRQAVTWDPRSRTVEASNDADIVNRNVGVFVSGATIATDWGGGEPLGGWRIGVTSGGNAVEGAPKTLDADGTAMLATAVESIPATYVFALAGDQDDELDGGEKYETETVEYTHTGLERVGTRAADTLRVRYATQTLKVYVHHERDQVEGYTGNVLDGDVRAAAGMIDVELRYVGDAGRSRRFAKEQWDPANGSERDGTIAFRHVPTDFAVLVRAEESAAGIREGVVLLEPDELLTYADREANGVVGSAFGAMGGFGHTVELCPLQAAGPQGHDECASFAYVTSHTVSGTVWRRSVAADAEGDGFGTDTMVTENPGVAVALEPIEGRSLAGEAWRFTTAARDFAATAALDETHQFSFEGVAAGVYEANASDGWRVRVGGRGSETELTDELDPLGGDVHLDVTPSTGTVYGRVTGIDGFPRDGAAVTANGKKTTTDAFGRYVLEGIAGETRRIGGTTHANRIFVNAAPADGGRDADAVVAFAANALIRVDVVLSGAHETATVEGAVRASGSNAPIADAEIQVDYGDGMGFVAPENAPTSGENRGKLATGADGAYTAIVAAKKIGETASVRASKVGMSFVPDRIEVPAHSGASISGIDFTGFVNATIAGRVAGSNGRPLVGVVVKARRAGAGEGTPARDSVVTGETGMFSLGVPFGSYVLTFEKDGFAFEVPVRYRKTVDVAPGQVVNVGLVRLQVSVQRTEYAASEVDAARDTATADGGGAIYNDDFRVTWKTSGYPNARYRVQTRLGTGAWTDRGAWVAAAGDTLMSRALVQSDFSDLATGATDAAFQVRIKSQSLDESSQPVDSVHSDSAAVAAIDPMADRVTASRTEDEDSISFGWRPNPPGRLVNGRSSQRIVTRLGDGNWYVLVPAASLPVIDRGAVVADAKVAVDGRTLRRVDGTGAALTGSDARAELLDDMTVAVEMRQGASGSWNRSDTVSLLAVPETYAARGVVAVRDTTTATGGGTIYNDDFRVMWRTTEYRNARYRIQTRFGTGAWTDRGAWIAATGAVSMSRTLAQSDFSGLATGATDAAFQIRIKSQSLDASSQPADSVYSTPVAVAAIDPEADRVTVSRTAGDDSISFGWRPNPPGRLVNGRSSQRIVARLADGHWYAISAPAVISSGRLTTGARVAVAGRTLTRADGTDAPLADPRARAELLKDMTVAVEMRQGSSGSWNRSDTVFLAAAGEAYGARDVDAARDTATAAGGGAIYNDAFRVAWKTTGYRNARYRVQTRFGTGAWTDRGAWVAAAADTLMSRTLAQSDFSDLATGATDAAFQVRVKAQTLDGSSQPADSVHSDSVAVPAIDPTADEMTVSRTASDDSISFGWRPSPPGSRVNGRSQQRVVVRLADGHWYVVSAYPVLSSGSLVVGATVAVAGRTLTRADGTDAPLSGPRARTELLKGVSAAVEMRQGASGSWNRSGTASLLAASETYGARDVSAVRDTATATGGGAIYNDTFNVAWKTTGYQDVRYRVQTRFGDGAWTDRGAWVAAAADTLMSRTLAQSDFSGLATGATDAAFQVRIKARVLDASSQPADSVYSTPVAVAAIDPEADRVTVSRTAGDDSISFGWRPNPPGRLVNGRSSQRIVARLADGHWYAISAPAVISSGRLTTGARVAVAGRTLTRADGTDAPLADPRARAELLKDMTVAVEMRQGSSGSWNRSDTVFLAAAGEAYGARDVDAARDTTTAAGGGVIYNDAFRVAWKTTGYRNARYRVQTRFGTGAWTDRGAWVAAAADTLMSRTLAQSDFSDLATGATDAAFQVRVKAQTLDGSSQPADSVHSDSVAVPAIDPTADEMTVSRTASDDSISFGWRPSPPGSRVNGRSQQRVVVRLADGHWYVVSAYPVLSSGSLVAGATVAVAGRTLTRADGTDAPLSGLRARIELLKGVSAAVEMRQGASGTWNRSGTASLSATDEAYAARDVGAVRDSTTGVGGGAIYNDAFHVAWKTSGYTSARYRVQTRFGGGAWTDRGAWVAAAADTLMSRTLAQSDFSGLATGATDAAFQIRIKSQSLDASSQPADSVFSAPVAVAAIDPEADRVTASRTARGDSISFGWRTSRVNGRSQLRVVARLGDGNWYVLSTPYVIRSGRLVTGSRTAVDGRSLSRVDGTDASLTDPDARAELLKAMTVAVEVRQGASGTWNRSGTVSLFAGDETYAARNVGAERLKTTEFGPTYQGDSIGVTWRTSATRNARHRVQARVGAAAWRDIGAWVSASGDTLMGKKLFQSDIAGAGFETGALDAAFQVRIKSQALDGSSRPVDSTFSAPFAVPAIDPMPKGFAARRAVRDNGDPEISTSWGWDEAAGGLVNPRSKQRLVVLLGDGHWYVLWELPTTLPGSYVTAAGAGLAARHLSRDMDRVDGTDAPKPRRELFDEFRIAVEMKHGSGAWNRSNAVHVPAASGTVDSGTFAPREVAAERSFATDATELPMIHSDTVRVTWKAYGDSVPSGYGSASFGVEYRIGAGSWTAAVAAGSVASVGDSAHSLDVTASSGDLARLDNALQIRVKATAAKSGSPDSVLLSSPAPVAAIDPMSVPVAVTVSRIQNNAAINMGLNSGWFPASRRTQLRIVAQLDDGHWYELGLFPIVGTNPNNGKPTRIPNARVQLDGRSPSDPLHLHRLDGTDAPLIGATARAKMRKATTVALEARRVGATWNRSATVALAAETVNTSAFVARNVGAERLKTTAFGPTYQGDSIGVTWRTSATRNARHRIQARIGATAWRDIGAWVSASGDTLMGKKLFQSDIAGAGFETGALDAAFQVRVKSQSLDESSRPVYSALSLPFTVPAIDPMPKGFAARRAVRDNGDPEISTSWSWDEAAGGLVNPRSEQRLVVLLGDGHWYVLWELPVTQPGGYITAAGAGLTASGHLSRTMLRVDGTVAPKTRRELLDEFRIAVEMKHGSGAWNRSNAVHVPAASGTVDSGTFAPREVAAERSFATDATELPMIHSDTVRVTWKAYGDSVPSGYGSASFGVEYRIGAGSWTAAVAAGSVESVGDSAHSLDVTASSGDLARLDNALQIRVKATAAKSGSPDSVLLSSPAPVAAIDPMSVPVAVTVSRIQNNAAINMGLNSGWFPASRRTQLRIVAQLDDGHWYELGLFPIVGTNPNNGKPTRIPNARVQLDGRSPSDPLHLHRLDGTDAPLIGAAARAKMRKATTVALEARRVGATWNRSATVALAAEGS